MGIAVVNSNDRMYFASQQVLKEIEKLKNLPAVATPAENVKTAKDTAANAEFFVVNAPQGGTLARPISADTANLNYLINNDAYASEFYSLCNSPLAERNYAKPELFQPMLAEKWTISKDRMSYHIKLKNDVYWQSFTDPDTNKEVAPVQLTAHDFKFFADVVRNKDVNASALRVYYQDLEDIEVTDDLNMIIRWKTPKYGTLSSTLGMMPLQKIQ